jgi:hypothetical protein
MEEDPLEPERGWRRWRNKKIGLRGRKISPFKSGFAKVG